MRANFQAMAKNTTEEKKSVDNKGGNSIESVKKELGPMGFIGTIGGIAVIIVVAVIFIINNSKENSNLSAHDELFQAQLYFEADSLDLALNGDGRNLGFLSIIDIYGGTDAANLANYYAGTIFLKQGKFDEAREHLQDFSTSEVLAQARANEMIGDTYLEQGNYTDAANSYEKAADGVDDKFFSPRYLLKAALAHENNGDINSALAAVNKIIDDYFGASDYNEARKQKARLEILANR